MSGGRTLRVSGGHRLFSSWSRVAPHLPGVHPGKAPGRTDESADLDLPRTIGLDDARRLVNAHLHLLHLGHDTLCAHAVALHRDGLGAVLLLGGHGAGKTLVGVALAMRGWHVLAGDVTLLDVGARSGVAIRGGTAAFLVRRGPALRWFPELPLGTSEQEKVDFGSEWTVFPDQPVPVVAAVSVHISEVAGPVREIDRHTARTLWLRASGHLLDRMLDSEDGPVLRLLEASSATRRRVALVRALAAHLTVHAVWGPPADIAAQVERLAMINRKGSET